MNVRAILVAACLTFVSLNSISLQAAGSDRQQIEQQEGKVNINTANLDELTKLRGIGKSKSQAIVAYRESNGGFTSLDQLTQVAGIGQATLEKNRDMLTIE